MYLELENGSWNVLPISSVKKVIYFEREDYVQAIADINSIRAENTTPTDPKEPSGRRSRQKGYLAVNH